LKYLACLSLSLLLLVLTGCDEGSDVPKSNVTDYRILFSNATATESCSQDIQDSADTFTEFAQIYRLHFPEGEGSVRVDLYWKNEGDTDESFTFFAAGTLVGGDGGAGTLDSGELNYAGGSFHEARSEGKVTFEIEGRALADSGDRLSNAHEEYVITESTSTAAYPIGCVYTLDYNGTGLAEQGDDN
jgi:hypothetical protein